MRPSPRRVLLAALLAVAGCGAPEPQSTPRPGPGDPGPLDAPPAAPEPSPGPPVEPPASPPPGPVVVGSGSGRNPLDGSVSGSRAIAISADKGLYVLDLALAGEPRIEGEVYVSVNGAAPPAGTLVELNGIALVRQELPGSPESPFRVDVAGTQPEPDADGMLTVTVRSAGQATSMSLPCPPDLAVTSSSAPDSSIRRARAIELSWSGELEANAENPFPTAFTTSAKLMHYSYATHALGDEHYATKYVADGQRSVRLEVAPSDDGYCAELRWQGRYVQGEGSRGFCGRAKRIEYRY